MSSVAVTTTIALSALHLRDDTAFMFGSSPRNVLLSGVPLEGQIEARCSRHVRSN